MAEDKEVSWRVLAEGTTVSSADGEELGQVSVVVADEQKDIFSGLAFRSGILGAQRFVPADRIDEITTERVVLNIEAAAAEDLESYDG